MEETYNEKLSYRRGTVRRAMIVEILSITANCTKNPVWKGLQLVVTLVIETAAVS